MGRQDIRTNTENCYGGTGDIKVSPKYYGTECAVLEMRESTVLNVIHILHVLTVLWCREEALHDYGDISTNCRHSVVIHS